MGVRQANQCQYQLAPPSAGKFGQVQQRFGGGGIYSVRHLPGTAGRLQSAPVDGLHGGIASDCKWEVREKAGSEAAGVIATRARFGAENAASNPTPA